jgi:hypothetical protein
LLPGGERAFSWSPAAAASLEPGATLPATGELIDLMVNAFYVTERADHMADHRV